MKKKFASILLSLAMVVSCLFVFTACGDKKDDEPPAVPTVASLSVELVTTGLTMTDGTITYSYGSTVELDSDDFKLTASYSDETTKVISLKSDTNADGYTFASTVPSGEPTAAGEYKLTFTYSEKSAEVKVKVNKGTVDMTGVRWDYDTETPFTYDKTEKSVEIDESTLPVGVTVSYEGNTATNAGTHRATATFAYTDTANYETIAPMTLDWTINKADIDVSEVALTTGGYYYNGSSVTPGVLNLPTDVVATPVVAGSNTKTDAGRYEVEYAFEYTGEDAENYNAIANRTLWFEIYKGTLVPRTQITLPYNGTEQTYPVSNIIVPAGVTITAIEDNTGTEIATYNATITVSYSDELLANYENVTTLQVSWKIVKADYDMTGIAWDYQNAFTYDATEKTVAITGTLPNGVTVKEYYGNTATNVNPDGYVASVVFNYDSVHYNEPTIENIAWEILPKELTVTAKDATVAYGTLASNTGVDYLGFATGEDESVLSGTVQYHYSGYSVLSPVGTYVITPYGLSSVNYNINYVNGTLTVKKADVDEALISWDMSNYLCDATNGYYAYYDRTAKPFELVNETGVLLIASWSNESNYMGNPSESIPTNIGAYSYQVTLSLSEADAVNYNEFSKVISISVIIRDYVESITLSYVGADSTEIEDLSIATFNMGDPLTTTLQDKIVTGIEVAFVDEVASAYEYGIYTNTSFSTMIDYTNISNLENTLYLVIFKNSEQYELRQIDIGLSYTLSTSDKDEYDNIITKTINVSTEAVSFMTESETYSIVPTLAPADAETSPFSYGYSQIALWDSETSAYGTSADTVTLADGINQAKLVFAYVVNGSRYTYEKEISIVKTANSYTYCDVENNEIETSYNVTENISPYEISINAQTGYKEVANSRQVLIVNGAHYLVVQFEEDDSYSFAPYSVMLYEDAPVAGLVTCYIRLKVSGILDKNFQSFIDVEGENGRIDEASKIIYVTQGHAVNIQTKNENAKIYWRSNNESSEYNGLETGMAYIIFNELDYNGMFYIRIVSTYYEVYQTGESGETYVEYKVIVEQWQSPGGDNQSGSTDATYNVTAQDYFGNWLNNQGEVVTESANPTIEVVEGDDYDTITLTNWNETKYLNVWGNSNSSLSSISVAVDANDDDEITEDEVEIIEGPVYYVNYNFRQAGTYYLTVVAGDGETTKAAIITVSGDFAPFMQITANGTTLTENVDEDFNPYGDFLWYQNMFTYEQHYEAYVGENSSLGANLEIAISTAFEDSLYKVDSETGMIDESSKLSVVDRKLTLDVLTTGEIKYVAFAVYGLAYHYDGDNTLQAEPVVFYVEIYFCEKSDRLSYHGLTVGESSFDVKIDVQRYGDFGEVVLDTNSGGAYVFVPQSDLEEDGTAKLVFSAYQDYVVPTNAYDYLIFTEEGNDMVGTAFNDGAITSFATFGEVVSDLIAEGLAYRVTNDSKTVTISLPINEYGYAEVFVVSEGATESMFDYLNNMVAPFQIRVDGLYIEQDSSGGGAGITPNGEYYDYAEEIDSGLTMEVVVNGVTYSTENGDFYFEQEISEYYVRLDHTKAELMNVDTGMVAISSFIAQGYDYTLFDMNGNEITEQAFALSVTPHPYFGDVVTFMAEIAQDSAMFVLAFNDSMPEFAQSTYPNDTPSEVSISFKLTGLDGTSRTYSTENNKFYFNTSYAEYGYYHAYTRIDFEEIDFEQFDENGNLAGSGGAEAWVAFDNLSITLEGATFSHFVNGWNSSTYTDKKGGVVNNNDYGVVIRIGAVFDVDGSTKNVYIDLVFKDSIPMPYDNDDDNSSSEIPTQIISVSYGDGLTLISEIDPETQDFIGEFQMTHIEQPNITFVAYVGNILEDGQTEFTLNEINCNGFLFYTNDESNTYIEIADKLGNRIAHTDMVALEVALAIDTETSSVTFVVTQYYESEIETIVTYTIYFTDAPAE